MPGLASGAAPLGDTDEEEGDSDSEADGACDVESGLDGAVGGAPFLVDHVAVDEGGDEGEEADDGEHGAEAEPGAAAFRVRHGVSSHRGSPFAVAVRLHSVAPAWVPSLRRRWEALGRSLSVSMGGWYGVVVDRRQLTWVTAGAGLILFGVVGVVRTALPGLLPPLTFTLVGNGALAVSMVLFGVGLSRESSVVARGPIGVGALVVLGLWPLVTPFLVPFTGTIPTPGDPLLLVYGIALLAVPLIAAVVAVLSIARARVVPSPWRWAPLWALLALVGVELLVQGLMFAASPERVQSLAGLVVMLQAAVGFTATVGLGALAIFLAARASEQPGARARTGFDTLASPGGAEPA